MTIFTMGNHHKWAFLGDSTTVPIKSEIADGGHLELCKMLISPKWIDICTKFSGKMHHGHTEIITQIIYVTKNETQS